MHSGQATKSSMSPKMPSNGAPYSSTWDWNICSRGRETGERRPRASRRDVFVRCSACAGAVVHRHASEALENRLQRPRPPPALANAQFHLRGASPALAQNQRVATRLRLGTAPQKPPTAQALLISSSNRRRRRRSSSSSCCWIFCCGDSLGFLGLIDRLC